MFVVVQFCDYDTTLHRETTSKIRDQKVVDLLHSVIGMINL